MTWTTTPPTGPGWYWVDSPEAKTGFGVYQVHVSNYTQKLYISEEYWGMDVSKMTGRWYGPLEPPS